MPISRRLNRTDNVYRFANAEKTRLETVTKNDTYSNLTSNMFEIQSFGITKNGINAGCWEPREFSSKFDVLKYFFKRQWWKIDFFYQKKWNFGQKWHKRRLLGPMWIFDKILRPKDLNFGQKSIFVYQKFKYWWKIGLFIKNLNFGQKSIFTI